MKQCTRCKQTKPKTEFYRQSKAKEGYNSWCKQCCREYERIRYDNEPALREKKAGVAAAWRRRHPEKNRASQRNCRLKREYGIDQDRYEEMLAEQDGKCACCGRSGKKLLVVDHDHKTGRVRGLICKPCNVAIAQLGDDEAGLRKALEYVTEPGAVFEPFPFVA